VHSTIRDEHGRLVPVVRPSHWQGSTVKRSRERTARIEQAREARKRWLATTRWMNTLERRGIAALEASGIPWMAVQRWIDELHPREAFTGRRLVTWVIEALGDHKASSAERFEARRELYRRLIAAGILE